jgi:site-specific recombinase XerD
LVSTNPVREVKTEKVSRQEGKTPAFELEDMQQLFASFDVASVVGLRDRALIAVMAYTFARVGATVSLDVEDYYAQGKRSFLRLAEKGGKQRVIPCPHRLEEYLDAYVEAAGLAGKKGTPLFRSTRARTKQLTENRISRTDAYAMIRRRTEDARIPGTFGCHSFRATGITTYLSNGGTIERAQWIAGHANVGTTQLYDKRNQRATLEDLERVRY